MLNTHLGGNIVGIVGLENGTDGPVETMGLGTMVRSSELVELALSTINKVIHTWKIKNLH